MKIRTPNLSSPELTELIARHNDRMTELATAYTTAKAELAKTQAAIAAANFWKDLEGMKKLRTKQSETLFNACQALVNARKDSPFLTEIMQQVEKETEATRAELAAKVAEIEGLIKAYGITAVIRLPYDSDVCYGIQDKLEALGQIVDSAEYFLQNETPAPIRSMVVLCPEVAAARITLDELRKG